MFFKITIHAFASTNNDVTLPDCRCHRCDVRTTIASFCKQINRRHFAVFSRNSFLRCREMLKWCGNICFPSDAAKVEAVLTLQ